MLIIIIIADLAIFFAALEEKFPEMGITVHSRDPWVVTMDNFFTATEADALVAATVGTQEFIRSTDTGTYDEKTGEVSFIFLLYRMTEYSTNLMIIFNDESFCSSGEEDYVKVANVAQCVVPRCM